MRQITKKVLAIFITAILYGVGFTAIIACICALAGCQLPQSPEHSYVIDRTGYKYTDQEHSRKIRGEFFDMFAKNPTAMKNVLLEMKYPKCNVAGCPGRVFDGVCDDCGKGKM